MSSALFAPLNSDELEKLNHFLSIAWKDPLSLQLTELHGLLTAVLSAPHIIMPSMWQPMVLGNAEFLSLEQANDIIGLLMRFNNQISSQLHTDKKISPFLWVGNKSISLEEAEPYVLSAWCKGYLTGTEIDPLWCSDTEARKRLLPFSVFAIDASGQIGSGDLAIHESNQQWKKEARKQLPEDIYYFFEYWSEKRKSGVLLYGDGEEDPESDFYYETDENRPYERAIPKLGRNDPCPCGSRKKYKKCCGSPEKVSH